MFLERAACVREQESKEPAMSIAIVPNHLCASLSAYFLAAAAFVTPTLALAGEHVALETLPAPVKVTVQREVGSGSITEIERDFEHGRFVYEVEFVKDGVEWEVEVAEDGAVLERSR
jgi:hypothetical protein